MRASYVCIRVICALMLWHCGIWPATGLEPIPLASGVSDLDITDRVERISGVGNQIEVLTAPGEDGVAQRIVVRTSMDRKGDTVHWVVFALENQSDERIERVLVAEHRPLSSSGLFFPDLTASRITAATPSQGRSLMRWPTPGSDVFAISLGPDEVMTFVLELEGTHLPALHLWEQSSYGDQLNFQSFFQGIVVGIAGMLAVVLTVVSIVRWNGFFPAAASFAWSVLAYLIVDLGFLEKILGLQIFSESVYRATVEVAVPMSLALFLVVFLNLCTTRRMALICALSWFLSLLAFLGMVITHPALAAGLARLSFGLLGFLGMCAILFLAARRFDRAIMLIPSWALLLVWLFCGALSASGRWESDIASPILVAGILMVVLMITVTIMQHAFSQGQAVVMQETDAGRKALALSGSGEAVWDWDVGRKTIFTGSDIASILGYHAGELSCSIKHWLSYVYFSDQERFASMLQAAVRRGGGRIDYSIRMLCADGHYMWLRLKARPVQEADGRIVRCIGTLSDVTEERLARERLLHDAVYDSLTGLPGEKLFLDRLDQAVGFANAGSSLRPIVLMVDIDDFQDIQAMRGRMIADSILLMVARKLARQVGIHDTVCRLSGGKFGVILFLDYNPQMVIAAVQNIQKVLRSPVLVGQERIHLGTCIGIAFCHRRHSSGQSLLSDAEVAVHVAKKQGLDRYAVYNLDMQHVRMDRELLAVELRKALDEGEIKFLYRPIYRSADVSIAGFEVLTYWAHPRLGRIWLSDLKDMVEDADRLDEVAMFALSCAAVHVSDWQSLSDMGGKIFVSLYIPESCFLHPDFVRNVGRVLSHTNIDLRFLNIEVPTTVFSRNIEHVGYILNGLKELGVGLVLDDFGSGHFHFECLERSRFDMVKIDRALTRTDDWGNRSALLGPLLGMLGSMNMSTLAGCVESFGDVAVLRELGCRFVQGDVLGGLLKAEQVRMSLERSEVTAKQSPQGRLMNDQFR